MADGESSRQKPVAGKPRQHEGQHDAAMALDEPFEGPTRHGGYEEEREAEPQQRLVGMGVGAGFGEEPRDHPRREEHPAEDKPHHGQDELAPSQRAHDLIPLMRLMPGVPGASRM